MADMGFMPQVEWVLRRLERDHQTLLFSATLDGAVDRLVSRYLTDPVLHEVASSDHRPWRPMEHRFLEVHQMDRVKVCAAICRSADKALVFVRTKHGADRLVEQLGKEGVRAGAIHGDLRQANRERTLKDFTDGKLARPGGDRRGRPGPPHRRGRRRDPLRPAGGPQGVPAPVGPHRPGRVGRPGRSWSSGTRSSRSSASRRRHRRADADRRDVLERPPAGRPRRLDAREVLTAQTRTASGPRSPAGPSAPARSHRARPPEPLTVDDGSDDVDGSWW